MADDGNSQKGSKKRGNKKAGKAAAPVENPSPAKPAKVQILKREPQSNKVPSLMEKEIKPQSNKVPSLMEKEIKSPMEPKPTSWGPQKDVIRLANQKQTKSYYFSEKPGTAVPANSFQESVQYKINNFPLERNTEILIEKSYKLLLTPTNSRCNGLSIRVRSQHHNDDSLSADALLRADANDKEVRHACKETIENFNKVVGKSATDRYPFSECSEEFLAGCFIKRLDDRLDAFPEAIYYCDKCDYHISTISHAKKHLESSTHFDDVERQTQRQKLLDKIPKPSKAHLAAVRAMLEKSIQDYQEVRNAGEERTKKILHYLETKLFASIDCENVEFRPFGSVTYGVMLPDSDINVAYTADLPDGVPTFAFMEKVRRQIVADGYPADHTMEMGTASTILFTFEETKVSLCWLSCFAYRSQLHFSELMKTYTSLRPEVVGFLQLIRLWATKSGVDSKNKQRIGLPRYGFDIMAIHYLQQKNMLPVLHEMCEEVDVVSNGGEVDGEEHQTTAKPNDDNESVRSKNQPEEARQRRMRLMSHYLKTIEKIEASFNLKSEWKMPELWIGFFKYYVKGHREVVVQITQKAPMTRDVNRWNKKVLHVVDPFRSDNVLSIPKVSTWQPFYFNCLLTTFLAFSIPRVESGPVIEVALYQTKSASPKKKVKDVKSKRLPEIVPQMRMITEEEFNNAADDFADDEEQEQYQKVLLNRLEFDGIKLCALKPADVEIDDHVNHVYSSRTMRRVQRVHQRFMTEAELKGPLELGVLRNKQIKRLKKLQRRQESLQKEEDPEREIELLAKELTDKVCVAVDQADETIDEADSTVVQTEVETASVANTYSSFWNTSETGPSDKPVPQDSEPTKTDENPAHATATFIPSSGNTGIVRLTENHICTEEFFIRDTFDQKELIAKSKGLRPQDFRFDFSSTLFCGGYEMETKCTHCDGGHCVEKCPMMEIPAIQQFAPRTPDELKDIDDVIDKYYVDNILDQSRLQRLEAKVKDLETYLKRDYREDVTLTIFGSVMTGLSVNRSDVDVCLRFGPGDEPPRDLTARSVIEQVGKMLRRCPLAKRVEAIGMAKVPIVKFQMKIAHDDNVDVDISYYNILALQNTLLLKEYTLWTPDNRFAKLALFIKNWAKTCEIGDASRGSLSSYAHIILLISYLQQCDPPVLPRLQEDFRNGTNERRIIENWDTSFVQAEDDLLRTWPKNKESCAQLLIGYLDYYSRFNFRNFVVQCRREMILSKVEKDWPRPLCVEDPFDLSHNLSSGITKKMFVFIMRVFIGSREVFMSSKPEVPRDSNFLYAYRDQLLHKCSQGSAPTDRQCHNCHRIGHFVESCPMKALQKEARRRYASNTTNSSYRSNGYGSGGDPERLTFYKRTSARRGNSSR